MSGDSSAVAGLASRSLAPSHGHDPLDSGEIGWMLRGQPGSHGPSGQGRRSHTAIGVVVAARHCCGWGSYVGAGAMAAVLDTTGQDPDAMVTPPDIETQILRYYHAEKWTAGTIARQLHVHHSVVRRVLAQAGLPRIGPAKSRSSRV